MPTPTVLQLPEQGVIVTVPYELLVTATEAECLNETIVEKMNPYSAVSERESWSEGFADAIGITVDNAPAYCSIETFA